MDSAGERFAAIQEALADRKNILTVKELCELAGVSRSGYYNWVRSERARETREQRDRADFEWILEAYRFRSYAKGARGIHMRLLHMGVRMNVKKIRRLMRSQGRPPGGYHLYPFEWEVLLSVHDPGRLHETGLILCRERISGSGFRSGDGGAAGAELRHLAEQRDCDPQ